MIDLELLRITIVDCCTNANGSTPYSIQNKLVEMGYPSQIVFNQLIEYKKLNLFDRAGHETDGGFYVFGLSQKGYELYGKINTDKKWKNYQKEFTKPRSKLLEKLAEFIGISLGEFYKHIKE